MKRVFLILAALAAWTAAAATPNRTATEAFVTNKIAEAVAAIPAPDYSTNNAALVVTIQAKAPAPGNYAAVSNAAMSAVQSETDPVWAAEKGGYATKTELASAAQSATNYTDSVAAGKQDTISDLAAIRSGAALGATALQSYTETDPTVPQWAKAGTKPTYTASEVGAATPADVTAAIREQSLGGIWDESLQVWWTPRMRNGSLTYEATTNVNLNAEN